MQLVLAELTQSAEILYMYEFSVEISICNYLMLALILMY